MLLRGLGHENEEVQIVTIRELGHLLKSPAGVRFLVRHRPAGLATAAATTLHSSAQLDSPLYDELLKLTVATSLETAEAAIGLISAVRVAVAGRVQTPDAAGAAGEVVRRARTAVSRVRSCVRLSVGVCGTLCRIARRNTQSRLSSLMAASDESGGQAAAGASAHAPRRAAPGRIRVLDLTVSVANDSPGGLEFFDRSGAHHLPARRCGWRLRTSAGAQAACRPWSSACSRQVHRMTFSPLSTTLRCWRRFCSARSLCAPLTRVAAACVDVQGDASAVRGEDLGRRGGACLVEIRRHGACAKQHAAVLR
jgi:hypothetical protein